MLLQPLQYFGFLQVDKVFLLILARDNHVIRDATCSFHSI